ncbi:MAG: class I SAM-dependent methyltransferase [Pseudomonadota bacterium]|nr:class I SAM-dependent methyltransferase [Pseudomonadota bacterium]
MHHSSLPHLERHHRDFEAFRDTMIETAVGRFGPIWWGVWDQLVRPVAAPTLVDLGTGPGMLLPQLRARHPDARIVGVEVQPAMLGHARPLAAGCGAEIVEADVGAGPVPLPDGVADVVTAVHVLHELEHPPSLVAEMRRLLAPGGVAVLYDWVKRPLAEYLDGAPLTPDTLQHFREHCLFTPEDLEFLLRREGFAIRETIGRRGGRYAIVVAERGA